jgi:NADPH-dependent 2,4-dienoyl-CoA reductase/sulfur reductase-like enzyme/rhodanese-related sulfurtransferase
MSDPLNVLVIGGTACGPKTACRLKRVLPSARVTVLEKGHDISFGACGMPYFVAGTPDRLDALSETPIGVKRTPGFFSKVKGVEIECGKEVLSIDREAKSVQVREAASGETTARAYDKLVLATGARPLFPPIPGIDTAGVQSFHALRDAEKLDALLRERPIEQAVIVGAGLIGIEMAEALVLRGLKVTLIEKLGWLMPALLDEEMGRLAGKHLAAKGVELVFGSSVDEFVDDGEGRLAAVKCGEATYPAQLAVVAIGVRPNDELAREAGLEVSELGGILVDEHGRTSDPDVYAGGDCVVSANAHPSLEDPIYAPQGSTANKQGRAIANHIAGMTEPYPEALGTVICKAFEFTLARTGLSESQARAQGFDVETALCPNPDRPHYMPGAAPIVVKLVATRAGRKLLGCQIVGPGDAAKRLDVVVTAMSFGASIDQLARLDLGYAPPYSPPIDPLLTAAHVLQNKLDGIARGVSPLEAKGLFERGEVVGVDVRSPDEFKEVRLPYEVEHIPLGALREKGKDLPKDRELLAFCKVSLRGYEAQRILQELGFEKVRFLEGGVGGWPFETVTG